MRKVALTIVLILFAAANLAPARMVHYCRTMQSVVTENRCCEVMDVAPEPGGCCTPADPVAAASSCPLHRTTSTAEPNLGSDCCFTAYQGPFVTAGVQPEVRTWELSDSGRLLRTTVATAAWASTAAGLVTAPFGFHDSDPSPPGNSPLHIVLCTIRC